MSWQEDFAAARRADPEAPARLGAYLGPFVHSPYLARLSSIAAARATRARVTQALAALASGAEPAEAWMAKLLEETRTEAAALSLDPAQVQEHPDESIAGTEARRLLGQLSPMAPGDRELAILRLVEGIGASELGQVAGETEALGARLLDACRQALTLLGSQAPTGDDAYLLEPRLHAPTQAVVSVENHLEPLRYNEDQLPASALAPVAPLLLDPPPPPGFVWDDKEVTGTEVANPNETAQTRVNLPRALSQPVEVLTPPMGPPEAVPTARVPADVAGQTAVLRPVDVLSNSHTQLLQPVVPVQAPARANLLIAAVLAVIGAGFAATTLWLSERRAQSGQLLEPVLVASCDLPGGSKLDANCLAIRAVPASMASVSVVHPGQLALVVGMRLVFPMQPGDPLLWTHLPGSHTPERLSETLLGHTRAYALRVSNTTSSNGMLRPSDRVDVLVSAARPGESREVATLVQDVPILAVGLVSAKTIAFPQGRPAEYQSVSLAVAAEEAELLALAARAASTQFTLRNAEDHEREARRKPSQISDLLGEARALKLSLKRSAAVHAIRSARP